MVSELRYAGESDSVVGSVGELATQGRPAKMPVVVKTPLASDAVERPVSLSVTQLPLYVPVPLVSPISAETDEDDWPSSGAVSVIPVLSHSKLPLRLYEPLSAPISWLATVVLVVASINEMLIGSVQPPAAVLRLPLELALPTAFGLVIMFLLPATVMTAPVARPVSMVKVPPFFTFVMLLAGVATVSVSR